nr:cysteine-rich CWC family protein [Vibrio palustris]
MLTPCRAACKNEGGLCTGCHRTMDEILDWRNYTPGERQVIMDELSGKRYTHPCPACHKSAFCGITAGQQSCWCMSVEERDPCSANSELCLCRSCLTKQSY